MLDDASPFLSPSSLSWIDMLTDGAIQLIDESGMSGLTLQGLAAWLGVTPAAVSHRTRKDQLSSVVVDRFRRRWLWWIETRLREHGVLALLPTEEGDVPGLRVWLAIIELSRDNEAVARCVSEVRAVELAHLARLTMSGDDDLTRLMALIDGLRLALCAPLDPMPVERAMHLLASPPSRQ
jgi:hypothetical protein